MPDMTHEQMIANLTVIGGGAPGRGTIKASAKALGVSERTVANAARGDFADKFAEKVSALADEMRRREAEETLYCKAGTYVTAHVENWQPGGPEIDPGTGKAVPHPSGTDIWDECVVTRMKAPKLIMHVAALRRKNANGDAVLEKSVFWIDQPADDARRAEVMDEATERARAFLAEKSVAVADIEMRRLQERKVAKIGILTTDEASRLSHTALKAELVLGGRELEELRDELSIEVGKLTDRYVEVRKTAPAITELLMDMRELGFTEATYRTILTAIHEGYDVPIARLLAGKAYRQLGIARKDTYRRGRADRQTADLIEAMTVVVKAADEPIDILKRFVELSKKMNRQYWHQAGLQREGEHAAEASARERDGIEDEDDRPEM